MNKITITPEAIRSFADRHLPAMVTITSKYVTFNSKAAGILALKNDDIFHFEIDHSNNLLIKIPVSSGFKIIDRKKFGFVSPAANLKQYIQDKFKYKDKIRSITYELGEFKDGVYPMINPDLKIQK